MHFCNNGNWFDTTTRGRTVPVTDVHDFRTTLEAQIRCYFDRAEEHWRKDRNDYDMFGNRLATSDKTYHGPLAMVRDVKILASEERFEAMRDYAAMGRVLNEDTRDSTTGGHRAFLTFHGTSNPEALNSIMTYGFLQSGQQHPRYGYHLNMRIGNVFGDGVYSSSDHEVAAGYAATDDAHCAHLIVSVLLPGKIQGVTREWRPSGKRFAPVQGHSTGAINLVDGASPDPTSRRYEWAGGANTLTPVSGVRSMWIAGDSDQIVPVAVVTYSLNPVLTKAASDWTKQLHGALQVSQPREIAKLDYDEAAAAGDVPQDDLVMTQLCHDYYALPATVYRAVERRGRLKRYFVVPRTLLFDRAFVTALTHHISSYCGGHHTNDVVMVYGAGGVVVPIDAAHFTAVNAKHAVREKMPCTLRQGLEAVFDRICAAPTPKAQDATPTYHAVHMFLDQPATIFTDDDLDVLERGYAKPLAPHYINVKTTFTKAFAVARNATVRDRALMVRKTYAYEAVFEAMYFDMSEAQFATRRGGAAAAPAPRPGAPTAPPPTGWSSLLWAAEEELKNIGSGATSAYLGDFRDNAVTLETGARVYGEGFMTAIDETPVWSGRFSAPVVYKGTPPRWMYVDGRSMLVRIVRFIASTTVEDHDERTAEAKAATEKAERKNLARMRALRMNTCPIKLEACDVIAVAADGTRIADFVDSNCQMLALLLSRFRNKMVATRDTARYYLPELQRIALGIVDICQDPKTDVVVGKRLTQLTAEVMNDINTLSNVPFTGAWFQRFQTMRHGKSIMRRLELEGHLTAKNTLNEADTVYALERFNAEGIPIRVLRSAASEVEPWLIVVDHVGQRSVAQAHAGQCYRNSELGISMRSVDGEDVTDVFVWPPLQAQLRQRAAHVAGSAAGAAPTRGDPSQLTVTRPVRGGGSTTFTVSAHQVLRSHLAYVFTRNPFLTLRQQSLALRTVTFVRLAESLLLRTRARAQAAAGGSAAHALGSGAPVEDVCALAVELATNVAATFERVIAAAREDLLEGGGAAPGGNDDDAGGMGEPQASVNLDELEGWRTTTTESWVFAGDSDDETDPAANPGDEAAAVRTNAPPPAVTRDEVVAAPSLCAVLGRLLGHTRNARRRGAMTEEIPQHVKFDLLAESIVRLVHSVSKSTKRDTTDLLRWTLQLPETIASTIIARFGTLPDDKMEALQAVVDVERACRRTGKFLKYSYNNCSPFAVVAALGFVERFAAGDDAAALLSAFADHRVSMGLFLQQNAPTTMRPDGTPAWAPKETQLALFVFAIMTHARGTRRPSFSACVQFPGTVSAGAAADPISYVADVVHEHLTRAMQQHATRAALSVRLDAKQAAKRAQLSLEVADCLKHHKVVKLFSSDEVAELNRKHRASGSGSARRAAAAAAADNEDDGNDDGGEYLPDLPFERMPSGLLLHHCSYPDCPDYLKCFASRHDHAQRARGRTTRHGLMHHLQRNWDSNNYVPRFHAQAKRVAAKCMDFETFVRLMDEEFQHCLRYRVLVDRPSHLRRAWDIKGCK